MLSGHETSPLFHAFAEGEPEPAEMRAGEDRANAESPEEGV
jgi:hypothetical protein